ncbi:MAG: 1-acyl-sn-glycerol-3-phosphate acyltransferase [Bacteroidia bacterium]
MLYWFLRLIIGWYMQIHAKRLFVRGLEQVPQKGPLIFAANHGNAFLDATLLVIILRRPVWYLARADVFKKPWQRFILKHLHLIPVYRIQDGVDSMENNKKTFEICTDLLKEGKSLLIFSEGNAKPEHRLRPLKKGTARIAVQAAEAMNWPDNFVIMPLGINYTEHTAFRTELMFGFGKPIVVNEFKSEVESDLTKGLKAITHAIFDGIIEEILHIPEKEQDPYAQIAMALGRGEKQYPLFGYRYDNEGRLEHEQKVLANFIEKDNSELREKLMRFSKRSSELHLPLALSYSRIPENRSYFLILGFLPALAGLIFHAFPMSLAFWFTGKTVRDPQFVSSVLMVTGFFLNLIWYILWIIGLLILYPIALIALFFLPFCGRITLLYSEALAQQRARSLRMRIESL